MDLKKANGEDLRRIREVMGNGYEQCDGTEAGIEAFVKRDVPWVHHIDWQTLDPGLVIARVRLRWWAWFTLGVLHYMTIDRARAVIDHVRPATVFILVALW